MREIKFRAWFTLENKMVEHENLSLQYDNNEGFTFAFDNLAIIDDEHIKGTLNFELMQFTNVHDDEDDEGIYVGHIVELEWEREIFPCKVSHEGPGFMLVSNNFPDGYIWMSELMESDRDHFWIRNCKIIGNIYANPELMEG